MFRGATAFNQPLNTWIVSSVTNMSDMFRDARAFNGDISKWDVCAVTNMNGMFERATAFNQDINTRIVTVNGNSYTAWYVNAGTDKIRMFVDSGLQYKRPRWY